MDEKENIIKYYSKTGESLTNLTGFSLDTRVGATTNAFVLLKFLIKELLQLQLSHQKINYYSTLIRVTSLSCEKVHRTFLSHAWQRKKTLNHPIFIGNSRFFVDLHDNNTVQILMRTVRLCVHLRCDIFDLHTSLLCKVLSLTFLPAMRIIQLKSAFSAMRIFQFYITLTISLITFQQSHYVTN